VGFVERVFGLRSRAGHRANQAILGICVLLLAAVGTVSAQNINARIQGTVTDSTGALVANAAVSVVNEDTNVVAFSGKTDSSGTYRALQVVPGRYKVTATAQGFQSETISGVNANIDQGITLNFELKQGAVTQSVVVNAATQPTLDQTDATISTTITPDAVQDLPLPNRNATSLLLLTGGVSQGSNTNSQNNSQLSVNGSRTLGTNPLLDGTSLIVGSTGAIDPVPSPDALNEVKIIASNSSAQYGRTSGATLAFSTKSGTNKFHGAVYTLIRNEALDANTFANKLNGLPRNRDRFLQYGFAIGGPVIIPKLYNGRNKTFFFFNYDETVNTTPTVVTQTVPDQYFRAGNFFAATTPVYNPVTHQQYLNNTITPGSIDPAAAKYMALLPLPNSTGSPDPTNSRNINNWVSQQSLKSTTPMYTGRFDETVGTKLTIFGSENHYLTNGPSAVVFNPTLDQNATGSFGTGWESALGATYTITPTLIAQGHLGFYRDYSSAIPASLGVNVQQTLGIQSAPIDQTPTISMPTTAGGTTTNWGTMGPVLNSTLIQLNQTFSYSGSLMKIIRQHTITVGGEMRNDQFERISPTSYNNANFSFDGSITNAKNAAGAAVNNIADFLLGAVKTAQYEIPQPGAGRRNYNLSFFVQDDWRVNANLTLNLGLRQEYESPLTMAHNIYTRFDPSSGVLLVAGQNASASLNTPTPKVNIGPHVGFAYTPHPNLVVRGGFALIYAQIFSNLGGQVSSPGYDVVTSFNSLGPAAAQSFTLSQGIPLTGIQNLQNPAASLGIGSPSAPLSDLNAAQFFSLSSLPSVQQWNLGIQQELGWNTVFELNYVGNHGVHLPLTLFLNQPQLVDGQGNINVALANSIASAGTTVALQNARPLPNLQALGGQGDYAGSHYDSLQAAVKRQFTSSIAFVSTYTWSKSIDDASGIFSFSQPGGINSQVAYSGALRKTYDVGPSIFDQRNALNAGFLVTSKGNRWTRDFRLSGIFVVHSGHPLTITQTNEFPGVDAQRPDGNAGATKLKSPYHNGKAIQYLETPGTAGFPLAPTGPYYVTAGGARVQLLSASLGNSGRGTVTGPGENTLNLAVSRTFAIFEGLHFQLRVDALNALNHTNLQPPSTALTVTNTGGAQPVADFSSGSFGQITTGYQTRELQLLGRFTF
jgi:hypothetical protein